MELCLTLAHLHHFMSHPVHYGYIVCRIRAPLSMNKIRYDGGLLRRLAARGVPGSRGLFSGITTLLNIDFGLLQ